MRRCEPQQRHDSIAIHARESACLHLRERQATIAFDIRHDGNGIACREDATESRSNESIIFADVGLQRQERQTELIAPTGADGERTHAGA